MHTGKDGDTAEVQLLPPLRLRLVDAANGQRREEVTKDADGDRKYRDEPEHPQPARELHEDGAYDQLEDCRGDIIRVSHAST